jgi:competence protein ComEC
LTPVDEGSASERPAFVVHIVDVGTGLGVFVEGPDFSLVYDAGSNDDTATGEANRFVAYVRAAAPTLRKIDHVLLSHPHRDHVELLPDLIRQYAVGDVWDSGAINPICGYRLFVQAVEQATTTRYHTGRNGPGVHELDFGKVVCNLSATVAVQHSSRITEGEPMRLGKDATMTFLHVDGEDHGQRFNENSLFVVLDLGGVRVLLVGDAEAGGRGDPSKAPTPKSVEGYLLSKYRHQIDADVLVAGHHGSKSSSRAAFVDAVTPKVSVISSGPMKYQTVVLPDAEIVSELEHAGELFRTDRDDVACARATKKIGPDADNKPGGCDNVQIKIKAGTVKAGYVPLAD